MFLFYACFCQFFIVFFVLSRVLCFAGVLLRFYFFYECIICWGRAVFRRSFLELMFVFGKRDDVAVLLLRFLFVFFNDCTICWRRVVFRRRFLELMFVFGKRNVVAVLLLRFLFVFFNECIVCWGRAVFCRRFLELVFVFGKRVVVAVVLFYLLRLFVFEEKMLLEEVGLRLSERFVNF